MGGVSPARGTLSLRRLVSKLHSISNRQHLRFHVKIAYLLRTATYRLARITQESSLDSLLKKRISAPRLAHDLPATAAMSRTVARRSRLCPVQNDQLA